MPIEKAKITFFNVDKCGLYKHGDDTLKAGGITEILDNLTSWSNGKDLALTKTYQVASTSDVMPAYLFDIKKKGGSYLVTIWNEMPSSSGAVASVDPNSSVGSVSVTMNPLKAGTLPGFATYFWFIPSRSVFASVQFQHSLVGKKELEKYLESFIDPHSKFVVFQHSGSNGFKVKKYFDAAGVEYKKLTSKFRSKIVRKPGDINHILNNYMNLEKVIRKTNLEMKNSVHKGVFEKLVGLIKRVKGIKYKIPLSDVNISYELPLQLDYNELNDIINDWNASSGHSRSEWDDYGFQFKGEMNNTYWLSSSLARDKFDLNITRSNDEVVDAQSLIDSLVAKQSVITRII